MRKHYQLIGGKQQELVNIVQFHHLSSFIEYLEYPTSAITTLSSAHNNFNNRQTREPL